MQQLLPYSIINQCVQYNNKPLNENTATWQFSFTFRAVPGYWQKAIHYSSLHTQSIRVNTFTTYNKYILLLSKLIKSYLDYLKDISADVSAFHELPIRYLDSRFKSFTKFTCNINKIHWVKRYKPYEKHFK